MARIASSNRPRIGKVVKSNSHCDYVAQVDDGHDVAVPPAPEDYGFGQFVSLESRDRHWAVGLIYNSQLVNPLFLNNGPRLSSEPDPFFTPDLIQETRTLLGVALIGRLENRNDYPFGIHEIPKVVVPVNATVYKMQEEEVGYFHKNPNGKSQFGYYPHLMRLGGPFAPQLAQQVLTELIQNGPFLGTDQRALAVLCKELAWKNTISSMR